MDCRNVLLPLIGGAVLITAGAALSQGNPPPTPKLPTLPDKLAVTELSVRLNNDDGVPRFVAQMKIQNNTTQNLANIAWTLEMRGCGVGTQSGTVPSLSTASPGGPTKMVSATFRVDQAGLCTIKGTASLPRGAVEEDYSNNVKTLTIEGRKAATMWLAGDRVAAWQPSTTSCGSIIPETVFYVRGNQCVRCPAGGDCLTSCRAHANVGPVVKGIDPSSAENLAHATQYSAGFFATNAELTRTSGAWSRVQLTMEGPNRFATIAEQSQWPAENKESRIYNTPRLELRYDQCAFAYGRPTNNRVRLDVDYRDLRNCTDDSFKITATGVTWERPASVDAACSGLANAFSTDTAGLTYNVSIYASDSGVEAPDFNISPNFIRGRKFRVIGGSIEPVK